MKNPVFSRNGWSVEVDTKHLPRRLYDDVFRTTIRAHRKCELFTLLFRESELALVQLTLFGNGDTVAETWYPAIISTDQSEKYVHVVFLEPVSRPPDA